MTIIRRIITSKGTKPLAAFQHKYKTLYLYGAVEPQTGDHFFFTFSHLDSVCFQVFLDLFSEQFSENFNIVLLDRGSFHRAEDLLIPENVFLIFQPAANPELNPSERVWQYVKDRLALENFDSLDALFKALSTILQDLTQETLQSLTGFEYFISAVNNVFI
jgi:transposase